jgi:hypothetical protein
MDDLHNLAQTLETLLKDAPWQPREARALLRAGRALAREQGCPGTFDQLLQWHQPTPPSPSPSAA